MAQKLSDEEFVAAWNHSGCSPQRMSETSGLTLRAIYSRRESLQRKGIVLRTVEFTGRDSPYAPPAHFVRRRTFEIIDGVCIVFSDGHFAPDHDTVGQDALETLCRKLKPVLVVSNGDELDAAQLSKWPILSHHKTFTIREQLDCLKLHMDAIRVAAGPKCQFAATLGNHSVRLSRYIAAHAEHFLDMPFTRLEDWIPEWPLSWSVEINDGKPGFTVIRHRNQAGMLHLQGAKAGCHYVHGHLHKLNVHRFPQFRGVTYSVDTGSLADPNSDVFDYTEAAPNHAQGFAVLTYKDGKLLPPELCEVVEGVAYFRGRPV